jgi:hypothetical protein
MRTIVASLLATSLLVSSSFAATQSPVLPAGKPAGVKEAAMLGPNMMLVFLSVGILVGGLTLAVSNNGNDGVTTPTTTSTSTAVLP